MSQENVELVRRAWEAHARHDNETALRLYASDIEVEVIGLSGLEVYYGRDGVRDWFRDMLGPLTDLATTVDEWIDAGDDVIAVLRATGRGRKSGVPVEQREFHVWTVRDEQLRRLRIYQTREEALEAVGLAE